MTTLQYQTSTAAERCRHSLLIYYFPQRPKIRLEIQSCELDKYSSLWVMICLLQDAQAREGSRTSCCINTKHKRIKSAVNHPALRDLDLFVQQIMHNHPLFEIPVVIFIFSKVSRIDDIRTKSTAFQFPLSNHGIIGTGVFKKDLTDGTRSVAVLMIIIGTSRERKT